MRLVITQLKLTNQKKYLSRSLSTVGNQRDLKKQFSGNGKKRIHTAVQGTFY